MDEAGKQLVLAYKCAEQAAPYFHMRASEPIKDVVVVSYARAPAVAAGERRRMGRGSFARPMEAERLTLAATAPKPNRAKAFAPTRFQTIITRCSQGQTLGAVLMTELAGSVLWRSVAFVLLSELRAIQSEA
jgi:hypothetical protein